MQFKDIIGQQAIKDKLIYTVESGKISHAQMFTGPTGNGKLALAIAYAQYIMCEQRNENDSCSICPSCNKIKKLIHPDVHFSYPVIKRDKNKKPKSTDFIEDWRTIMSATNGFFDYTQWLKQLNAEGKQGNIPIIECHDIIHKLNLKSYESPYKILIMWLPEFLGKEGNSLLKLIEEPPEKTLFLFVCEDQDAILNTIISRTQIVRIPSFTQNDIVKYLMNNEGIAEEQAKVLASMSEYNLLNALEILHHDSNDEELFIQWFEIVLADDSNKLVPCIDAIAKLGKEQQKNMLLFGLHFCRIILEQLMMGKTSLILNNRSTAFLQNHQGMLTVKYIEYINVLFSQAHYHLERNAHSKILFMGISIKILDILKGKKIALEETI